MTEKYTQAVAATLAAVREQQAKLKEALDNTREALTAEQAAVRAAVMESAEIESRLSAWEAELAKQKHSEREQRRSNELAIEIIALRERQRGLTQQESRLRERCAGLAELGQRLRLAILQEDEVLSLLSGATAVEDEVSRGSSALHVAQAQEDERARLAREIHDGPAQALANAIFELEFCDRLLDRDPVKLRDELARLKEDLRLSLADVRHFIFGLRPAVLRELGLAAALRRFVEGYQARCGIAVRLNSDEFLRLSDLQELAIFRIIQEALQNARKHSKAAEITLSVRNEANELRITIEDNGEGFDVARLRDRGFGHFGLRGMQERARLIGGQLKIESQPESGTKVTLVVPQESRDHCG